MTALNDTPTLQDRVSAQREVVYAAEQAWQFADEAHEDVAWELYSAEMAKLNALLKMAKVEMPARSSFAVAEAMEK